MVVPFFALIIQILDDSKYAIDMKFFLYALLIATLFFVCSVFAGDMEEADAAMDKKDYVAALSKYKAAATKGDAFGQLQVGNFYYTGRYGVRQNYSEAIKWYRMAAAQGYADGQFNLGGMYEYGEGVLQDYLEAVRYYRLAAWQGLPIAQSSLGSMYWEGKGVNHDLVRAHMWMNLAASQGNEVAAKFRERIAEKLSQSQIIQAQKMARDCQIMKYKNCF